jgi:hypothetical protein
MIGYPQEPTNLLQAFTAFLCGSIIVSSLLVALSTENEFITLLALMLTSIGILLTIDLFMPFDKMLHFFTSVFSVIIGGVASIIISQAWNSVLYLLISFVLIALIYLSRLRKKKK